MDLKTLDYMKERVKKAEDLISQIRKLANQRLIATQELRSIKFLYSRDKSNLDFVTIDCNHNRDTVDEFGVYVTACLVNQFVDLVDKRIEKLEAELAAI